VFMEPPGAADWFAAKSNYNRGCRDNLSEIASVYGWVTDE